MELHKEFRNSHARTRFPCNDSDSTTLSALNGSVVKKSTNELSQPKIKYPKSNSQHYGTVEDVKITRLFCVVVRVLIKMSAHFFSPRIWDYYPHPNFNSMSFDWGIEWEWHYSCPVNTAYNINWIHIITSIHETSRPAEFKKEFLNIRVPRNEQPQQTNK